MLDARGELLLDHVFITVKDLDRSIAFYERALKPLGIVHAIDYDGKDAPEGHPDLKGFGRDGRVFFWLRQGNTDARAAHPATLFPTHGRPGGVNRRRSSLLVRVQHPGVRRHLARLGKLISADFPLAK